MDATKRNLVTTNPSLVACGTSLGRADQAWFPRDEASFRTTKGFPRRNGWHAGPDEPTDDASAYESRDAQPSPVPGKKTDSKRLTGNVSGVASQP
ncbi:MAG TPA: hypothetical protein VK753_12965, partial [Xanthomonadaceae bacterium]|nr:hypothetical protein [Xanthomonadaceae bacterium]